MNNYCTNCGNKLEKDELVCKTCNTPIIDLPYNYDYKSPKKTVRTIIILIVIGICILFVIVFNVAKGITNKNKINKMQKEYIEPYLNENYGDSKYFTIEYDSSGKCIISGNCNRDFSMGCDGGEGCQEYKYLDEKDCKSYYYSIKSYKNEFILTVVEKNKQFYVVEEKNVYGTDKNND